MTTETTTPPKGAYCFKTLQDPGMMFADQDGATDDKRPVRLVAFTGKPVKHWWWGTVIFDRKGFEPSSKQITIDFNHNPDVELGYLDGFSGDQELICTGYLLPNNKDPQDITANIIRRAKLGREYQCSVTVDEYRHVEELQEGASAEVNGQIMKATAATGPIRIFRKYKIMGVALCSYATDKGTKTDIFNEPGTLVPGLNPPEKEHKTMPEPTPTTPPATDDRMLFKTFQMLFGNERAATYFSDNLTKDQAMERYFADVKVDLKKFSEDCDEKDKKIEELEDKVEELEKDHKAKVESLTKEHGEKVTALQSEITQLKTAAGNFTGEPTPVSGNQQTGATPGQKFSPFTPEQQAYAARIQESMTNSKQ